MIYNSKKFKVIIDKINNYLLFNITSRAINLCYGSGKDLDYRNLNYRRVSRFFPSPSILNRISFRIGQNSLASDLVNLRASIARDSLFSALNFNHNKLFEVI